jgi:hypothetical protein
MVNIDMFRHPKYYKELRKLRNKEARRVLGCLPTNELYKPAGTGGALCVDPEAGSDQVISETTATANGERAPGPGPKQQASSTKLLKEQAASIKRQA